MKNKSKMIKKLLLSSVLTIAALTLFTALPEAMAQTFIDPSDNPAGTEGDFRVIVLTIIQYFLGFLGLLAVIMVIYGGVTYTSSAGNDEAVQKAKKIIMYSVIGIIVIFLAFALVNTVIASIGG